MKIKKIVLVASSLFVMASCGSVSRGSDIKPAEAKSRIDNASKKVSSTSFEFPTKFNFEIKTQVTENNETEESLVRFSIDSEKQQFYFLAKEDDEKSEMWAYKDGDKCYTASADEEGTSKSEVNDIVLKATLGTITLSAKASVTSVFSLMNKVVAGIEEESSSSSESTEGYNVTKNEHTLKSKGEGHLYIKYEFNSTYKIDDVETSEGLSYELAFDNYLPVLQAVSASETKGRKTSYTRITSSFDWNNAAYPGNPNF